jgi:hypothetical protein
MSPTHVMRLMAAICVLLALTCAGLAWQYRRAIGEARCWRAAAEEGVAPEGDCARAR